MSKDILTTCKGWTPIIDVLADELGLMTAACYGIVWRHCQMRTGICYASVKTLAEHLGISEKSVRRHLKKLCGAGYLEDMTPGVRNKPHTYKDTAKVELRGSISVVVGQSDQAESGWSESPTGWSESPTDSLVRESNEDTKDTKQDTNGDGVLTVDQQITSNLLQQAGINGAGQFLNYSLPHVEALLDYADSHNLGAGWIAERLRKDDWQPRQKKTKDEERAVRKKRYTRGKYADRIES